MALKLSKHDPSQPPPVISPFAKYRRFAVLYVFACLLSAFTGVVAISNIRPDHRYVSFLGGDNDWRPIQQLTTLCGVFGAIVFALALAMPLWIGKRGGFQLVICSLILSVAYLGCAAGMTTIPTAFYVLVGTINVALAAVGVGLTPPKS